MSYLTKLIMNFFLLVIQIKLKWCIASHHTSKKELCSAALVGSSVSLKVVEIKYGAQSAFIVDSLVKIMNLWINVLPAFYCPDCPNGPNIRIPVPKCGLKNNCI